MASLDTPLAETQRGIIGSNSAYFRKLRGRAKRVANDEAYMMADSMMNILKFRKSLGKNYGNSPDWSVSNPSKIPSKLSRLDWVMVKHGVGYAIVNKSKNEDFTYVSFLTHGASMAKAPKGWFESALRGTTLRGTPTRLKINNGRVFSSQMQFGTEPWIKIKRIELKNNIRKEFKRLGIKHEF